MDSLIKSLSKILFFAMIIPGIVGYSVLVFPFSAGDISRNEVILTDGEDYNNTENPKFDNTDLTKYLLELDTQIQIIFIFFIGFTANAIGYAIETVFQCIKKCYSKELKCCGYTYKQLIDIYKRIKNKEDKLAEEIVELECEKAMYINTFFIIIVAFLFRFLPLNCCGLILSIIVLCICLIGCLLRTLDEIKKRETQISNKVSK